MKKLALLVVIIVTALIVMTTSAVAAPHICSDKYGRIVASRTTSCLIATAMQKGVILLPRGCRAFQQKPCIILAAVSKGKFLVETCNLTKMFPVTCVVKNTSWWVRFNF